MRTWIVLFAVVLSTAACISQKPFQVIPGHPDDLLRWPDTVETPIPQALRHYNGFEPGHSWVELRPRMELRVENAYYQEGMPKRGLTGFLGTEVAHYRVRAKGGLSLLSFQAMNGRPLDQLPVQTLIRPAQQHHRYYRFYYEVFFKNRTDAQGSVLLGAQSRRELEQLGEQLSRDPGSICGEQSRHCTVFPEACSVSLEMEIVVNGVPQLVTWGTVLASVAAHPRHVTLLRLYRGRFVPVHMNAADPQALRLPLLPGDRLRWD